MRWWTFSVVAAATWVAQTTVAPRVSVGGVQPDWVLVVVVFFALYAPRRDGCVAGWVLGLGADLLSVERLGAFSLIYGLTAVAVGSIRDFVFLRSAATHFVVTLVAGMGVVCAGSAYRSVLYPLSVSGWWSVTVEGFAVALYSAGWAVVIHPPLVRCARALGVCASRSVERDGSAMGRVRV